MGRVLVKERFTSSRCKARFALLPTESVNRLKYLMRGAEIYVGVYSSKKREGGGSDEVLPRNIGSFTAQQKSTIARVERGT